MRVKECQQMASQLQELRSHADAEADGLRARLAAALSDREKAELSLQQAHQLLGESSLRAATLLPNLLLLGFSRLPLSSIELRLGKVQ